MAVKTCGGSKRSFPPHCYTLLQVVLQGERGAPGTPPRPRLFTPAKVCGISAGRGLTSPTCHVGSKANKGHLADSLLQNKRDSWEGSAHQRLRNCWEYSSQCTKRKAHKVLEKQPFAHLLISRSRTNVEPSRLPVRKAKCPPIIPAKPKTSAKPLPVSRLIQGALMPHVPQEVVPHHRIRRSTHVSTIGSASRSLRPPCLQLVWHPGTDDLFPPRHKTGCFVKPWLLGEVDAQMPQLDPPFFPRS